MISRRSFLRTALVGLPLVVQERIYAARSFNASNQQFVVGSAPITGYPATLACFCRKPSNALRCPLGVNDSGGNSRFYVVLNSSGQAQIFVTSSTNQNTGHAGSTTISNNTWFHMAGVFASATSRSIFLNGSSDGSGTTNRTVTTFNQTYIGALYAGTTPGNRWSGEIAEACIYNVALTSAEIAALSDGADPRIIRPSALVFYCRCDRATGDEIDIVGGRVLTHSNDPGQSALHPRIY